MRVIMANKTFHGQGYILGTVSHLQRFCPYAVRNHRMVMHCLGDMFLVMFPHELEDLVERDTQTEDQREKDNRRILPLRFRKEIEVSRHG